MDTGHARRVRGLGVTLVCLSTALLAQAPAADSSARDRLHQYIDGLARIDLAARTEAVAVLRTRQDAERRRAETREKLRRLIGGLPDHAGRVAVKEFGSVMGDGFQVDKIAYESLPGFWVTADLYRPIAGNGPFPAIVLAPGHGAAGKTENWSWGANFARNGILALAYDPIGQGERLQYYDAERKASFVGNPTGEHGEANVGPLLIGETIARYMVNDAMRGVDYLSSRADVDARRIGAFGCSGGGTMTAYFAALDDRVTAAAVACYITSFTELLASNQGAQDAEQSLPHFIEQRLDFADWIEAFAPKPYAVVSTESDMFPFAGARATVDEAKRFYGLLEAADRLEWITGPGGHGNLGPISPQILSFFSRHLKGAEPAVPFAAMRAPSPAAMIVTPTGQVSTSIGGESVYSIIKARGEHVIPKNLPRPADVQKAVRAITGAAAVPGARPAADTLAITSSERRAGYRYDSVALKSDGSTELPGILVIPDGAGTRPAVLLMSAQPPAVSLVATLAKANRVLLALQPRPTPVGTESIKSPYLGPFNLLSMRAFLVGRSLLGLRVDDTIRAVDALTAMPGVDRRAITGYGIGPSGMAVLHGAALDSRLSALVLEDTLSAYRLIVDQPAPRLAAELLAPGLLTRYDTGALLRAVSPRSVTIVSPRDATGTPMSESEYRTSVGAGADRVRLAADAVSALVN
jgi:cephalosporin-C deacetylase-like acetyl esterase